MKVFRTALKNADMETKKKLAAHATMLGLDLDKTLDIMDFVCELEMDNLRRNMETAGLTIVNGEYQEIRNTGITGKNTNAIYMDDIQVIDNDMKIYKEDPEE